MVKENLYTSTAGIWISKKSYCIDRDTRDVQGNIIDFLMKSLVPTNENDSFWFFQSEQDKTVKVRVPRRNYEYWLAGFSSAEPIKTKRDVSFFTVSIKGNEVLLEGHSE